jgi:uncharacterized protein YidB (DUF937 family)
MGLLDGLVGQALGGLLGGGQQNALVNSVLGMLGNQQGGGLAGLLGQLKQGGLEQHVSSWVGTGENMQVSGDQLAQALGAEQVANIAQQAGVEPHQASAGLAQLLPQLIDKLTPNGALPQGGELQAGLASLRKLLG